MILFDNYLNLSFQETKQFKRLSVCFTTRTNKTTILRTKHNKIKYFEKQGWESRTSRKE
jgi:hypothetical protein